MALSKMMAAMLFFAGLALLGMMMWQVGMRDVLASLRAIGPWLMPYLLLEGISHLLHAAGWASCFLDPTTPLRW